MQTPTEAAPANYGREVVQMMKLVLWYWQNPAVSLVLAKTTVKMSSLEHRHEKQTYYYLHHLKSNAQALEQKDNPGGSYLAGQSGKSICNMEETMDMAGAGEKVD